MLAHFDRITPTATQLYEPLYSNLFEVTFTFPALLNLNNTVEQNIMMIATKNIDLDLTPSLSVEQQKFKYAGRNYISTPTDTTIRNLKLNFNINVSDTFSIQTWNFMKKWYDLAWNSQTGELHYKRDMVGTIVAHIHDRKGQVIRRVEFRNCQITGIDSQTFTWDNASILDSSATFTADYWIDSYYDIDNVNN
jgi:hypothetical protein